MAAPEGQTFTRKVIDRRAQEARKWEFNRFVNELYPLYQGMDQLVFGDETAKDLRAGRRLRGYSRKGERCKIVLSFARGQRYSICAWQNSEGFLAHSITEGTFTSHSFYYAFLKDVYYRLSPWPGPNSIVIIDNARIHKLPELRTAIEQVGAKLIFLPPYSPHLNPIKQTFGIIKSRLARSRAIYETDPLNTLRLVFTEACHPNNHSLFSHHGYHDTFFEVSHK
ncbi:DDE superfamily endonuclease [Carpediemonas membranifera]|uniref:DDE superfamily endonuclease n=1 Tax=Carpediemonas membranifera TaxID=201153 RepID=A0A8J6B2J2_9EUKA|nr:DDE superfamily endonuclease [Carpediemonas membranifera]|eukprot:KAG9394353.1 DDE superfamily endonuclease [Carpediemonas membranifera]